MKKSIGLLSALVVTTTFIVNCQKAPDKRRVRPTAGKGSVEQNDAVQQANLKVCKAEVLDALKGFTPGYNEIIKNRVTQDTTEEQKKKLQATAVELMDKCKILLSGMATENEQGCKKDNGVNSDANILTTAKINDVCNYVGKVLEKDHEHKNEFSVAFDDAAKAKEEAEKVRKDLIGKTLKMSKEAISLVLEDNTNGGKFLADGIIGSSTTTMENALKASQTVCTFLGDGLEIDENKETTLKIIETQAAGKHEVATLNADFTGKSTLLISEIKQDGEESQTMMNLLCLNLDATKLSIEKITKALGTGITSAPAQVSTEVTDETSAPAQASPAVSATSYTAADLTGAQPAGSPQQQNLASGTAQMIAQANVITGQKVASAAVVTAQPVAAASTPVAAKVEAEEEEQVYTEPDIVVTAPRPSSATTVVTTTASGASVTVVTAQPTSGAATVVSADEIAMLKEKAERLEAEAVAAEADVKKLQDDKAKAEDIDAAKAKARITRESATTAKAEYEAAQRTAVAAK